MTMQWRMDLRERLTISKSLQSYSIQELDNVISNEHTNLNSASNV